MRKFAVAAKQKGSAFVPLHRGLELDRIFSIQQERVVNHDNTIRWANVILQIEPTRLRSTLAGCRVIVYEHLDQTVSIGWGPHTVGRYTLARTPQDDPRVQLIARPYKKKSARKGQGPISLATRSPPLHGERHDKTLWLHRARYGGIY